MATSKTLRGYQADLYRRVNRARNNGKDAVMLLPTGAGKTAIARNHCSHVLNHPNHTGIKRVIITTPQKQILAGFLRTNEEEWSIKGKHSSQKIDNVEIIEIANKDIGDFLKGSSGGSIAISCIQSITNQRSNAFNPFEEIEDCSSILWVIDEAHHIEAEQTARVIGEFKRKNGKILYLTATPFNANGALRILNNSDIEIIHRSLGEHMKDGFAPELEMSYEMFDVSAGVQTDYSYVRSDLSRLESWATSIASAYEKDNKPKTLVVIPSFSRSGDGNIEDLDTVNAANTLKAELEKKIQGIKVLSAVGNDASGDLSKAIEVEANRFPGHDIIIACRRFDEGTDVPTIGAVYLIGMTGCRRIIQLMGRALRNKSTIKGFEDKYPDYLNKSIFKFFIFNTTTVTDDDLEDNQYEFSLSAIKTINAVQNFRSYDVISGAVRVRRRLQERIEQLIDEDPDSPDIEILEELVSEIEQPIIALETSGEKDDSMLALMAHNHMDHTNEEALENASETAQAYVQSTLLSNELETDEDVEEFVERSISRKRRNRTANVINEELVELVTQYATEQVNYVESDLIKTFTTSINRNTLEEWGDVLWDITGYEDRQWDRITQVIKFESIHNKLPSINTDDVAEKKLAKYLTQLRVAKWSPDSTSMVVYNSTINKLKENNKLYILDGKEQRQCNQAIALVDWMSTNNRIPNKCEDSIENNMAKFLNRLRNLYNNPESHSGRIYPETYAFLEKEGKLEILQRRDFSSEQLLFLQNIVRFFQKYNRLPSPTSSDENEQILANTLMRIRSAKNNDNYQGKLYEESMSYLDSENMTWMLNNRDRPNEQLMKTNDLIGFYRKHGRFPSRLKADESSLYKFYCAIRHAYNTPERKTKDAIVYQETIDYLVEGNMLWILSAVDFEIKQNNKVIELINYINANNKLPNQYSEDKEERSLYVFRKNLRKAYLDGENTTRKIYNSTLESIKAEDLTTMILGEH